MVAAIIIDIVFSLWFLLEFLRSNCPSLMTTEETVVHTNFSTAERF